MSYLHKLLPLLLVLFACSPCNEIVVHRVEDQQICIYQTNPDTVTHVEIWKPDGWVKHFKYHPSVHLMHIYYPDSSAYVVRVWNTRADKKDTFIHSIE